MRYFERQYATVKFGDLGGFKEFLQAAFCGCDRPITNDVADLKTQETEGLFVWTGPIPGHAGMFYAVNPYTFAHAQTVLSDPKLHKQDINLKIGTGLSADGVGALYTVVAEIDSDSSGSKVTLAKQCQLLDNLMYLGLVSPNAVCLSGDDRTVEYTKTTGKKEPGKSLHMTWSCTDLTASIREQCQTYLTAIVGGDSAVCDKTHKMRLGGIAQGGWKHGGRTGIRVQTIIHLNNTPCYAPDLLVSLKKVADIMGVVPGVVEKTPIGSKISKSGVNKGDCFPENQLVRTRSGLSTVEELTLGMQPKETIACHCIHPQHKDTTPSAFLSVLDNNRPFIHCKTCNTTWLKVHPSFSSFSIKQKQELHGGVLSVDTVGETQEMSATFHPILGNQKQGVKDPTKTLFVETENRSERHLGFLDTDKRIVYVKSPRDTGKTTAIKRVIKEMIQNNPKAKIIIVVSRRTLADSLKKMSEMGFHDYRDTKGDLHHDKLVVVLDSIHRVESHLPTPDGRMFPKEWDLIWIDESEQLIQHIDSDKLAESPITNPEEVTWDLSTIIQNSKKIIMSDADLGGLTISTTRMLIQSDPIANRNDELMINNDIGTGKKADLYATLASLDRARKQWWSEGKVLAIYSTTKAEAKRINADLLSERPGSKIVLITGDTSGDWSDFLFDPDSYLAKNKIDALVYSPSMGTGVSISIRNYFDRVLGYVKNGTYMTCYDALQGVERVRNPKNDCRAMWLDDTELWQETDSDRIYETMIRKAHLDLGTAKKLTNKDN